MKIDNKELLAKIKEMPPFPRVAMKILELSKSIESNMNDIVELVSMDQVIAAKVLRLCNSAYFGLVRKIDSIKHGVNLVGTENLMKIVLTTMCSFQNSKKASCCLGYQMFPSELWRHSISCAFVSQKIIKACQESLNNPTNTLKFSPDLLDNRYVIFTACLLHDMGKLVLSDYLFKKCISVDKLIMSGCRDKLQIERILLETDHAEIGGMIAQHWGFPDNLVQLIRRHHSGMVSNSNPIFDEIDAQIIVNFSNLFTKTLNTHSDGIAYHIQPLLLKKFGFTLGTIDDFRIELETDLKKAADFLIA